MRVRATGIVGLLLLTASAPGPEGIEITVTNVREARGTIHVEVCPARLWLKKCPYVAEVAAKQGTTIVIVPNVPPGRYAVQAYHDRNRNGKADRNFVGFPLEDVGFSRNALKKLAPPRFDDAAIDHGVSRTRISFEMRTVKL